MWDQGRGDQDRMGYRGDKMEYIGDRMENIGNRFRERNDQDRGLNTIKVTHPSLKEVMTPMSSWNGKFKVNGSFSQIISLHLWRWNMLWRNLRGTNQLGGSPRGGKGRVIITTNYLLGKNWLHLWSWDTWLQTTTKRCSRKYTCWDKVPKVRKNIIMSLCLKLKRIWNVL